MAVEDKRNRRDEVAATADRAIPLDYESNRQPRDKDNHMLISSLYSRPVPKKDVNCRRINRERMRSKLAKASFIAVPRLVKLVKS